MSDLLFKVPDPRRPGLHLDVDAVDGRFRLARGGPSGTVEIASDANLEPLLRVVHGILGGEPTLRDAYRAAGRRFDDPKVIGFGATVGGEARRLAILLSGGGYAVVVEGFDAVAHPDLEGLARALGAATSSAVDWASAVDGLRASLQDASAPYAIACGVPTPRG